MLHIQRITVNFIEENCYVLWDESREAVIVDCGAFSPDEHTTLSQFIADHGLTVTRLLCTHGHFDHIFGAQFVHDTYGVSPELHRAEADTYLSAPQQMRQFLHRDMPLQVPAPQFFDTGDTLRFGSHSLLVIHTPGHTPGGVCFYCAEEKTLLSGDSLFRGSIGRCDLPGGDGSALVASLRGQILTLPDDVSVLPGHGPATTIGDERRGNMYLR